MLNTIYQPADSRGVANHGWLQSRHTFSFANYYEPARMSFGVLRVLNDDRVAGGMGFGMHPHNNMEIISIPLSGDLAHKDSMGNGGVIKNGDIQVMSAGTGITYSEMNANVDVPVKFLQIWVVPNKHGIEPRYQQISLDGLIGQNRFGQILSPNADDAGVWIHQDAWFSLGHFDAGNSTDYQIKRTGNGVCVFVISGKVRVNGYLLNDRDGLGVWNTDRLDVVADTDAKVLLMDVPMDLS